MYLRQRQIARYFQSLSLSNITFIGPSLNYFLNKLTDTLKVRSFYGVSIFSCSRKLINNFIQHSYYYSGCTYVHLSSNGMGCEVSKLNIPNFGMELLINGKVFYKINNLRLVADNLRKLVIYGNKSLNFKYYVFYIIMVRRTLIYMTLSLGI